MTERFRDRHRTFREQEIVRTAAQVISETSCRDFTMSEVAGRLGVSKATLYQHFRSREELIRRCVGEACRTALEGVRLAAERLPPDQRLLGAARHLVQLCLGVTTREDDPAPCCLAEIECPFLDWDETERLFSRLGAGLRGSEGIGLGQALRALSASVVQRRRAEGLKPTASDVDAVVRFLLPQR